MIFNTRALFVSICCFASFYFVGCVSSSPETDGKLVVGTGERFVMEGSERWINDPDSSELATYNRYFNHFSYISVPLNRYILADSYQVFTGIPFRVDLLTLYNQYLADTTFQVIDSSIKADTSFAMVLASKDSLFCLVNLMQTQGKNRLGIFSLSKDSAWLRKQFQTSAFYHRILLEK